MWLTIIPPGLWIFLPLAAKFLARFPKKMDFLKLTTVSHILHTVLSYFSFNQLFITKSEINKDGHNHVKINTNNVNVDDNGNKGNQLLSPFEPLAAATLLSFLHPVSQSPASPP